MPRKKNVQKSQPAPVVSETADAAPDDAPEVESAPEPPAPKPVAKPVAKSDPFSKACDDSVDPQKRLNELNEYIATPHYPVLPQPVRHNLQTQKNVLRRLIAVGDEKG